MTKLNYFGVRSETGCRVYIEEEIDGLNACRDLPMQTGERLSGVWGWTDNCPFDDARQLAVDILTDALGDSEWARTWARNFVLDIVWQLRESTWELSIQSVRDWAVDQGWGLKQELA